MQVSSTWIQAAQVAAVLCLFANPAGAPAQTLNGAGATFPFPVYSKWAYEYNRITGVKLNYQSVGSGAGIAQIKAKTVDFGASDAPLTTDELDQSGLVQFPMVMGGVVPVLNLDGVKPGQLRLTPTLLADIFLGVVKNWDDPAIRKVNPACRSRSAITVVTVRRFQDDMDIHKLPRVPAWHAKVGADRSHGPSGRGEGQRGVAAAFEA